MKHFLRVFAFVLLICGAFVFASCGEAASKPSLSVDVKNVELVLGSNESASFDATLSNYGNGNDNIRVETYETNIISITTKKLSGGKTSVTVSALYPGNAKIKLSSIQGSAKPVEVNVSVVLPVGEIKTKSSANKLYAIKGESLNISSLDLIEYFPIKLDRENLENAKTNQVGVDFSIDEISKNQGVTLIDGKLYVPQNVSVSKIQITAKSVYNGELTTTFEIKVLNKITSKTYIGENLAYENETKIDGASTVVEIFPREADTNLNKKVVSLNVFAGEAEDVIKVVPIFDKEKFSVSLTYFTFENGRFVYRYEIMALASGVQDGISFEISYRDYSLGENGEEYAIKTGIVSATSYNLPNSVTINSSTGKNQIVDVVVFQNVLNISNATALEFALTPSNLTPAFTTIRIWAEDYVNLPVNLYRLNLTRDAYELVFGFDANNNFVCSGTSGEGHKYVDIPVGTKLFARVNKNADDVDFAKLYAISANYFGTVGERTKIELDIKVNPGAKSIDLSNSDLEVKGGNSITIEYGNSADIFFAITPSNFDIGSTSNIKLKNANIGELTKLSVVSKNGTYLFVKATFTPNKLGSTKVVITLCDGLTKEFDLKVISTLEDISITAPDEFGNQVEYRDSVSGTYGDEDITITKLAIRNGISLQLNKIVNPLTAEYYLQYKFVDLTLNKTISEITLEDLTGDLNNFSDTSNQIDENVLKNYSIIQAKSNQIEGKTLIKINVFKKGADGEFEQDVFQSFYFLVEIYKGVDNFNISKNTHEIYTYDTVGDKNISSSITNFSISLGSINGKPTYFNNLKLLYNNTAIIHSKQLSYQIEDKLSITASFENNVWNFQVQSLKNADNLDVDNFVFVVQLQEVNTAKTIGGIIRIITKNAVEISDIELPNINLNEGVYIDNSGDGDEGAEYQIVYNIYTKDNQQPLNSALEFEVSDNFKDKVSVSNSGLIQVKKGFGGTGTIKIYPSSNYFFKNSGMSMDAKPYVMLKVVIANGQSKETAIEIKTADQFNNIAADKHYKLASDITLNSQFKTIKDKDNKFTGGLYGNGHTLTINSTLFDTLAGVVEDLVVSGTATGCAIANTNEGTIKNVSAIGLKINAADLSGALVGTNNGTITADKQTEIDATINGKTVGGIAGTNSGKIENIIFAGSIVVSAAGGNVGGIAGENSGTISRCSVIKYAETTNSDEARQLIKDGQGAEFIGGIAGTNSGTIEKCLAARYGKDVWDIQTSSTSSIVGGIVGNVTAGTVSECMTTLNLDGTTVGALFGKIAGGIAKNCFTLSKVSKSSAKALASDGINGISNSYSAAYYLEENIKTYLASQSAAANCVYCAADGNFASNLKDNFNNDVWKYNETDALSYLQSVKYVKAKDVLEINSIESGDRFLADNNILILYYYQLLNGTDSAKAKADLNNLNTVNLSTIFGEDYKDLTFVLDKTSSIQIVADKLKTVGVGKTTLTVQSKYASASCLSKQYTIYVIYPIEDFNIYQGNSTNINTKIDNDQTIDVKLSNSTMFTTAIKSSVVLNGEIFSIFTNLYAVGFEMSSTYTEDGKSLKDVVSGLQSAHSEYDDYKYLADGVYKITPDAYSKNADFKNLTAEVVLKLLDTGTEGYYKLTKDEINTINNIISNKFKNSYKMNIYRGASQIQTSIFNGEITPSNVLNFDAKLTTDDENDKLIVKIYDANGKLVSYYNGTTVVGYKDNKEAETSIFNITVQKPSTTQSADNYEAYFNIYISINDDFRNDVDKKATYKVVISDKDGTVETDSTTEIITADNLGRVSASLDLVVVPQEVISISSNHYAAKDSSGNSFDVDYDQTIVLRPGKNGLLAINLYPYYAKYSKIEIESAIIDNDYYVLFEQMIARDGGGYESASGKLGYASERNVNKLTIYYSDNLAQDKGMIYIRTKITSNVADGQFFPITIKVYPANDEKDVLTAGIVLASQTVDKAEITIDGKKDDVVTRGDTFEVDIVVKEDQELGNISVDDYEQSLDKKYDFINVSCNKADYDITDGKKHYKAYVTIGLDAEIEGDGVVTIRTTMFRNINGVTEMATDSITLRIVDFVIEGIYIDGNSEDGNVFKAPIQIQQELKFAFKFSILPTISSMDQQNSLERIKKSRDYFVNNTALKIDYTTTSNSKNYYYYINTEGLNFKTVSNADKIYEIADDETKASFVYDLVTPNGKLFDKDGNKISNNYVDFNIDRDGSGKPTNGNLIYVTGLVSGELAMSLQLEVKYPQRNETETIKYDFKIKVQEIGDEDNPIAITNEEEFINYMNNGSEVAHYILMNDLYLENFVTIPNTDYIETLDGNNKIITIKNFDINSMLSTGSNQVLNLSLFNTISENTTIKNLTINYYHLENIVVDEEKVSEVNVAGLFIENSGIIYNCEITALNMNNAKTIVSNELGEEQFDAENVGMNRNYPTAKYSDGNGFRVYFDSENIGKLKKDQTIVTVGGLGITNTSAGRITNSRVGSNSFTKVYRYKSDQNNYETKSIKLSCSNLAILAQADMAGFIVNNSGVISASAVNNILINNVAIAGTNLKTAGFVIQNNFGAYITGCYAKGYKKATDANTVYYRGGGIYAQGISAGFVYTNEANITDCYSNLTLGGNSTSSRLVSGFVYSNLITGEIERCYSASSITGQLTTRMPFSGTNAKGVKMQLGELSHCYYLVQNYDTESLLEEKYSTGAYALAASTLASGSFYGFNFTSNSNHDGVWKWTGEAELASATDVAISNRYLIQNYNGKEGINRYPYINGYSIGSVKNPVIIRSADEFNRAFGDESTLNPNVYYQISANYNKSEGIVFGSYRLVSHIDFDSLKNVSYPKIASSIMLLTTQNGEGGILDGNGLNIQNIEVALAEYDSVGFIGELQSAVVKNANLTIKQINGATSVYAGGVTGLAIDSAIINIKVSALNSSGENKSEINGRNIVGGVVGLIKGKSKLANISSDMSVFSSYKNSADYERISSSKEYDSKLSYAGGIAGIVDIYNRISQSNTSSDVNIDKLFVGGNSTIVEGYYVGGLIGYVGAATNVRDLTFEVASDDGTTKQKLNSTGNVIGGIIGINNGDLSELQIAHEKDIQTEIEKSIPNYYKSETSKLGNKTLFNFLNKKVSDKYVGGLVGEMKSGDLQYSFAKVDICAEADYAGGLVGYNSSNGRFDEVYAFGDVDAKKYAGGLIGQNKGKLAINLAVAINFYSKTNSNITEMQEIVEYINSIGGVDKLHGYSAASDEGESATPEIPATNIFTHSIYGEGLIVYNTSDKTITFCYNFKTDVGNTSENKNNSGNWNNNLTFTVDVNNNKITSVTLTRLGSIVGENKDQGSIDIGTGTTVYNNSKNVYANTEFTVNGVLYKLNASAENSLNSDTDDNKAQNAIDLVVKYDNFIGESNYPVLNRMFLGAGWDPQVWQKDSTDMLPKLIHGVVTKVLYIEKPSDFSRLWKYKNNDNVVIIGDDPATSFNPYKYDPADSNTWGEFSQAELTGLSVSSGTLNFDLSSLSSTYVPIDFKGVLQTERSGWTYNIFGLNNSLFNKVSGATISGFNFGKSDAGDSTTHDPENYTPLLAKEISDTTLKNITVQNYEIEINNAGTEIGILTNELSGVKLLASINFTNVRAEITQTANELTFGFIAPSFDGQLGMLNAIHFTKCTIDVNATNNNSAAAVEIGFLVGKTTGGQIQFQDVLIDGENNENEISISGTTGDAYIGGFIGNNLANADLSSYKNTNSIELIKNLTIDFNGVKTGAQAFIGLAFGVSNTIKADGTNLKISGTITNKKSTGNSSDQQYPYVTIGGFAGTASATFGILKVDCGITVYTKSAKEITVTDKNGNDTTVERFSAIGGVIGTLTGDVTFGTLTKSGNITVKAKGDTGSQIAIGGVVGKSLSNSHSLTFKSAVSVEDKDNEITLNKEETTTSETSTEETTTSETSTEETTTAKVLTAYLAGVVGYADLIQNKKITFGNTINISTSFFGSANQLYFGGVIGNVTDTNTETGKTSSVTVSGYVNINNTNLVTATANSAYVGGVIGYTIVKTTINGGASVKGKIKVSGIQVDAKIGGLVGIATSKLIVNATTKTDDTISPNDKSVIVESNIEVNVSGIVKKTNPHIGGVFGSVGENSVIYASHYKSGIITIDNVDRFAIGGIAGNLGSGSTLSGSYVSGHIEITDEKIGGGFTIGGVVGYTSGGTITGTYSWGNIRITNKITNKNDKTISIGGVVGKVGGALTFTNNKTLTTIYNKNWLGTNGYANALIGSVSDGGTITIDTNKPNEYCHQINLATDSYGTNKGSNIKDGETIKDTINDFINKFKKSITRWDNTLTPPKQVTTYLNKDKFDEVISEGSKLNPKEISSLDSINFGESKTGIGINEYYYYLITSNLELDSSKQIAINENAHIIGNGYTFTSKNRTKSPIDTNNGVITGLQFLTIAHSKYDSDDGSNVSGVAATNNGIIFAVSVKILTTSLDKGFSKEKWTQGINSGVASTNSGLIADTGVVVYSKSANAGFVNSNTGVISNCYANGVVQDGATNSFNGGSDGVVNKCYTTIRSNSNIFAGTTIDCAYDRAGTEKSIEGITDSNGITEKTTTGFDSNDINNGAISVTNGSDHINFGYPYHGGGAYSGFAYLELGTYAVPNIGMLEIMFSENENSTDENKKDKMFDKGLDICTDMDYAKSNIDSHTSISISALAGNINGNGFKISNIPASNCTGGYFKSIKRVSGSNNIQQLYIKNLELNYELDSTLSSDGTFIGGLAGNVEGGCDWDNGENNKAIVIQDVIVSGANITTDVQYVGGIVGKATNVNFYRVYNHNDISINGTQAQYVGGIVGYHVSSDNASYAGYIGYGCEFRDTDNNFNDLNDKRAVGNYGNIDVNNQNSGKNDVIYVGGIVGSTNGRIAGVYNVGNVKGVRTYDGDTAAYVGGIVGGSNSNITYAYNYGYIQSSDYAAGILAINNSEITIKYSFNYGVIHAEGDRSIRAGGIYASGSNKITINNCGNEGLIKGIKNNLTNNLPKDDCDNKEYKDRCYWHKAYYYSCYVGGITAYTAGGGSITLCYNSGSLSCSNKSPNSLGYVGGIAGRTNGTVSKCSMTGTMSIYDDETFGWIVGLGDSGCEIKNCYVEPSTVTVDENVKKDSSSVGITYGDTLFYDYQAGVKVISTVVDDDKTVENSADNKKPSELLGDDYYYGTCHVAYKGALGGETVTQGYWSKFKIELNYVGGGTIKIDSSYFYFNSQTKVNNFKLASSQLSRGNGILLASKYTFTWPSNHQAIYRKYDLLKFKGWYSSSSNFTKSIDEFYEGESGKTVEFENVSTVAPTSQPWATRESLSTYSSAILWTSQVKSKPSGFGTSDVDSAEDLAWIAKKPTLWSKDITLTADIDLHGYIWTPINRDTHTTETSETTEINNIEVSYVNNMGNASWTFDNIVYNGSTYKVKITSDTAGLLYNWEKDSVKQNESDLQWSKAEDWNKTIYNVNNKHSLILYHYNNKSGAERFQLVKTDDVYTETTTVSNLTFDGGGHTISGMAAWDKDHAGLLGSVYAITTIKNLNIEQSNAVSNNAASLFVGEHKGLLIIGSNCSAQGNVYSHVLGEKSGAYVGKMINYAGEEVTSENEEVFKIDDTSVQNNFVVAYAQGVKKGKPKVNGSCADYG